MWPAAFSNGKRVLEVCVHRRNPKAIRSSEGQTFQIEIYTDIKQTECVSFPLRVRRNINNPRESTFLQPISKWLQHCNEQHSGCWSGEVALPSRVLDVGITPESDDQIRLYATEGETVPYACLSYCWGKALPLRTTQKTYQNRKSGILFHNLPRTLQNAVTVARALGIKYIWVDALCIIQDSQEDWETQSSNMAAIYKNAYIVIATDISEDCNRRFLPRRSAGQSERILTNVTESDNSTCIIYGRRTRGHRDPLKCRESYSENSIRPLGERAWALQEEVLASRTIHFADTEL